MATINKETDRRACSHAGVAVDCLSESTKSMTKSWIEVFALAFLLGLAIVLMTVFNNAVIGGGSTVVDIAQHGEMVPELLLLHLVVWPVITVGLYQWHSRG